MNEWNTMRNMRIIERKTHASKEEKKICRDQQKRKTYNINSENLKREEKNTKTNDAVTEQLQQQYEFKKRKKHKTI